MKSNPDERVASLEILSLADEYSVLCIDSELVRSVAEFYDGIERLDQALRVPVRLASVCGYTLRQIAIELGTTEGEAEKRLREGLAALLLDGGW